MDVICIFKDVVSISIDVVSIFMDVMSIFMDVVSIYPSICKCSESLRVDHAGFTKACEEQRMDGRNRDYTTTAAIYKT